jgi:hypothetical protein
VRAQIDGRPFSMASSAISFWFELATGFKVTQTAWLRAFAAALKAAW